MERNLYKPRLTQKRVRGDYKKMAKKLPFGGLVVDFSGREESLEEVFGSKKIPPSEMTKRLWAFVKGKKLMSK